LIVDDPNQVLNLSGNGEVIEPDEPVVAIGSGGAYAHSAALALLKFTELSAAEIAKESMAIAARLCIYTNDQIRMLELPMSTENPKPTEPNEQL
jgi:ATP-dependent HslUV protease subunit HslV